MASKNASRGESKNRARVDGVGAGDVCERFSSVATADCVAPLVRGELARSAQALPACLSRLPAFAGSGADQFALELRQAAEHGQHQPPVCGRCVGPHVGEGSKLGFLAADCRQSVEKVSGRACQTGRGVSPSPCRRGRFRPATGDAVAGRSWLRSPLPETPSWLQRREADAPAPPRFVHPSILVRTRRSSADCAINLRRKKAQSNQRTAVLAQVFNFCNGAGVR
jgi:hypothetical protein